MKISASLASLMLAALFGFGLFPTAYSATRVIDLTRYGVRPDKKSSVTATLNSAIAKLSAECAERDTLVLRLAPGRYNFHPHKSTVKSYFISNHDQDNPKNVGIVIENRTNLIIDGQGAELLFHGRMIPVAVTRSSGCTLRDLSIDFPNPQISQISIESVDTAAGTISYRPAPWVEYEINDGKFISKGEGWTNAPCVGIAFEKDSRHIVYNTSDINIGTTGIISHRDGLITAPWRDERLKPGTVVAMRGYERPCPGVFIDDSRNITLENVKVHYAEGMGLIAQNTTNITLKGFGVCLRGDDDPRMFTTQADATHFSGCSGHISSTGGLYEGMMDDAINVHGTYLKLLRRIDDNTVEARYMHPQSYGFRWAVPGDTVATIRSSVMENIGGLLTVKSIEPIDAPTEKGAKDFRITFNEPLDPAVDPANEVFGIENLTATPSVYFADNIIRNNRARGALFSTPRKVVVEHNLFDHTSGSAILLCGDCNGWFETGACTDVTIRKNSFINALTNLFQFTNAVISIYPEIPDLEGQTKYFHSNVTITDNLFNTFDAPLLYAKSVKGLTFMGNTVIRNNDFPTLHWNQSPVWLQRVDDARIQATSGQ